MNRYNPASVLTPQSASKEGSSEARNNGSPLDERAPGEVLDELKYDPIPPKKTVTVSVRYCSRGRGQPLPYPLDEGDYQ